MGVCDLEKFFFSITLLEVKNSSMSKSTIPSLINTSKLTWKSSWIDQGSHHLTTTHEIPFALLWFLPKHFHGRKHMFNCAMGFCNSTFFLVIGAQKVPRHSCENHNQV